MSIFDITILGVGLAMDAASITVANGMIYKNLRKRDYALMTIMFGAFQGIMPLIGYFGGSLFQEIITRYSGYVIFLILGVIGGKMIYDSFQKSEEKVAEGKLTFVTVFLQAIATSIDAFAVGVGFVAMRIDIVLAVSIIAVVTSAIVIVAVFIGKAFGNIFEDKAQLIGGLVLIAIGIKALVA